MAPLAAGAEVVAGRPAAVEVAREVDDMALGLPGVGLGTVTLVGPAAGAWLVVGVSVAVTGATAAEGCAIGVSLAWGDDPPQAPSKTETGTASTMKRALTRIPR